MMVDFTVCDHVLSDGELALLVSDISVGRRPRDVNVAVLKNSGR